MKNIYSTILIISILFSSFFTLSAEAGLKSLFSKKSKSKTKIENVKKEETQIEEKKDGEDLTLQVKAVYLELEGDDVAYDHNSNLYITTGMSTAKIVDQRALLNADKIVYNGNNQNIEATGNVKIDRDGIVTHGESFQFDVTSNKYLITDPKTVLVGAILTARELESLPGEDNVEYKKGTLNLDRPIKIAQGYGAERRPRTYYSTQSAKRLKAQATFEDIPKGRDYKIVAEKIVYDNTKTIKNLTIYKPKLILKDKVIPLTPRIITTVNSDEDVVTKQVVTPTLGTPGALGGLAVGPNYSFNIDDYNVISLSPFAQVSTDFGLGGAIAYLGKKTEAQARYGSSKGKFDAYFQHKLTAMTQFRAGYNRYLDDGFLGSNLTELNVGIVDRRVYNKGSILKKLTESGIRFRTEASWTKGDTTLTPDELKKFQNNASGRGSGTMLDDSGYKIDHQFTIVSMPLFKLGTEKYNTALRMRTRNALRLYSTGDFHGVFTAGPFLDTALGPLAFEVGYDQGYVQGMSPLFYDQYIEGEQSLFFDGDIKITENLSIGGYTTYNINDSDFVQRQFRAAVGPKDFKIIANVDTLRNQVQFGLNFIFGQPIDFERFLVVNSHSHQ